MTKIETYRSPKTKLRSSPLGGHCLFAREDIFINHSCDPNVGFDGQITYVAMRDVHAGEEPCYDYAMAPSLRYDLRCRCGSSMCRGIVTGEDGKKKDHQKRYGNYFSSYLLKKIKERDHLQRKPLPLFSEMIRFIPVVRISLKIAPGKFASDRGMC